MILLYGQQNYRSLLNLHGLGQAILGNFSAGQMFINQLKYQNSGLKL